MYEVITLGNSRSVSLSELVSELERTLGIKTRFAEWLRREPEISS